MSLRELNDHLKSVIPAKCWPADEPLLVDVWETNVIETASIQTWIPPLADGDPILEGIFSQIVSGKTGTFVGCVPLALPEDIEQQVLVATSKLILLFQQMGYIGRCSFDFLLVGKRMENAKVEFIECNGRWGGTSIPMTLVNRLVGDRKKQPFAVIAKDRAIPRGMSFSEVTRALGDELLRRSTKGELSGWLAPFNPGRLAQGGLNWIVFGKDAEQVAQRVADDLPARLQRLGPSPFRPPAR